MKVFMKIRRALKGRRLMRNAKKLSADFNAELRRIMGDWDAE